MTKQRTYVCIDLKSFYASVECVDRGLDPLTENLVVADPERSGTTICLAITPAMKALGIPNRCRLHEIPPGVKYEVAVPRMRTYMKVSADIYGIYLRYVSPDDVHVYSIDECFIDATPYLTLYHMTAREFAVTLMEAVRAETGILATAGIGTNLFLAKVALDVTAKHADDFIGFLDEDEFRRLIWRHRPITDIWNIGPGIARRLAKYRVFDLKGVTEMDPDVLYKEFGVNAEYLIDHAWGLEPCTIAEIKAYRPESASIMNGQILPGAYSYDEARIVLREMVDASVLDLVEKRLVTNHISLMVGYGSAPRGKGGAPDVPGEPGAAGAVEVFVGEHGARPVGGRWGAAAHATRKIPERTSSLRKLQGYVDALYEEIVDPSKAIRRISLGFGNLVDEDMATYDLLTDWEAEGRERRMQEAVLAVKQKFGKNALLKGTSFQEKATARERNTMVGGHRA
ncbi:DNA repair protein [Adlercreutzia faecimuris]|uniref:DNA repair protein n=1 Tax=Adlercreutzia faecimuris TaxID=2897341 RepID=A0ABS9WE45_9ACTN|nr:DNA repair protein [Adlercreutzia sp. JBNU-10]MCI2241137.1 DNA repair protein [Adlercreutzia sp. JBNU-10]